MKKLIIICMALCFCSVSAFAASTNQTILYKEVTSSDVPLAANYTNTQNTFVGDGFGLTNLSVGVIVEGYQATGNAQSFTAAGGFEVITNWTGITDNLGVYQVLSHTAVVFLVEGKYRVDMAGSFTSSGNNITVETHMYTNGFATTLPSIGWARKIATGSDVGSFAGQGTMNVVSGTVSTVQLDINGNTTLTWDHMSVIIEKVK